MMVHGVVEWRVFSVVQMYGLVWLIGLRNYLDDLDVFTLITSAICHDLDHPGYNNAYQVSTHLYV